MGSRFLLQGISPTQGSNPGLPHCRRVLYQQSHQGGLRHKRFSVWLKNWPEDGWKQVALMEVSTWRSYSVWRQFSSVRSLSHVRLFATPWIVACQASLSISNSRRLLKLMSIESVMPSSHPPQKHFYGIQGYWLILWQVAEMFAKRKRKEPDEKNINTSSLSSFLQFQEWALEILCWLIFRFFHNTLWDLKE